jgi:histidinol-phosphate aminotransferase
VIVICSPNNPTGCAIGAADLERILTSTDALVVVDEAYQEFNDRPSCIGLIARHPNLVVLRTFSKAMAMAGLRVGCLLASPDLAREIGKAKLPYNLNFFSEAAAIAAIRHEAVLRERIRWLVGGRNWLHRALGGIPGVRVYLSHANFLLFEVEDPKRIFEGLAGRGILIRDVSHYPMLSRALRVSVGTEAENRQFIEALRDLTAS